MREIYRSLSRVRKGERLMKTARGLQQSRRHHHHLYGGGRRRSSKAARSAPVSPFQNGTGGISLSLSLHFILGFFLFVLSCSNLRLKRYHPLQSLSMLLSLGNETGSSVESRPSRNDFMAHSFAECPAESKYSRRRGLRRQSQIVDTTRNDNRMWH